MRLLPLFLLPFAGPLAGCGHSSGPSGLTVTCNGQTALVGAKSVSVAVDPTSKTTVLTFPDPINDGQTGTIAVDRRCTIAPTAN